ncbi:MAG: cupin domain-containing protein, partial [Acidimicrobiales bacterium]
VKPAAGTDWCRNAHFQYQLAGRLHVILEDGTEFEAGPGSCVEIPPGHDAYVVGDETFVAVDWQGARNYVRS